MFGKKIVFLLILTLLGADLLAQTPVPLGPQIAFFNSNRVRGYHFTATSAWSLCGLYIPTDQSTGPMNVEFVRFTQGPPPAFAGTTNNFVSLFYGAGIAGTNMIPVPNIPIVSGNIYGTYGARSAPGNLTQMMNSYGATATVTNVNGTNMTLLRSGMQFPLNNQQMHDIWSEVGFNIGRIIMYYNCCPTPPAPQGPIQGPSSVCQGDTVQFSVPWDSIALSYTWTVGSQDSVIFGQGDSLVTVAIGAGSVGDTICVYLTDTCTDSSPICFTYSISLPPTPGVISGPDTVCANDTAVFSIPAVAGVTYNWTVPLGSTVISNPNSNTVEVAFGSVSDSICVSLTDNCATGLMECKFIAISTSPPLALAGLNQNICSGNSVTLQGNSPQIGNGTWSIVNGPGGGNIVAANDPNTTFNNLQPGVYTLDWTIQSSGCPSSNDQVDVTVGIAPIADFTVDDECQGAPAAFTNTSETFGLSASYLWDVENDGVDNYLVENPIHNYPMPGNYTVRMIASAQGCADTTYKPVLISPLPVLDISVDNVCLEVPAAFANASSISSGSIASVSYDFGDASIPDTGNGNFSPQYVYAAPGNYSVTVTGISSVGCLAQQVVNVDVYHLPVPSFTSKNACQFQTTRFTDKSQVEGATVDSWSWDFGDGSAGSVLEDPVNDYSTNGLVDVTLGVTSVFGCFKDTTISIEIFPTPVPEFNYTNKVCLGDTLFLEDVSSIDYGSIASHRWRIEDTIDYFSKDAWHYFPAIGWYEVSLRVVSDQSCVNSTKKMVPVWDIPDADFFVNGACAGDKIQFRDTTRFSNGSVDDWFWQFGDSLNSTSAERHPDFTYNAFGKYDVTLTVHSVKDCPSSVTYPLEIFEYIKPEFDVLADSGCAPMLAQFVDSSISKSGIGYSVEWIYGNGDTQWDVSDYVYNLEGGKPRIYDVTMRITTDAGCITQETKDSTVYVLPQPIAAFTTTTASYEYNTQRSLVQFMSLAEETNYWLWSFGDGEKSKDHNPAHFYQREGEYNVTLVAKNIYQCADTVSEKVNIEAINHAFIPKAFTPNGDGKNEVFKVVGLDGVTEFTMDIYDRWGQKIFSSTGVDSFWDGTNKQTSIVQQGLYLYKVGYVDLNGDPVSLSGEVVVVGVDN